MSDAPIGPDRHVPQTEENMGALALYLVRAPHVTGQAINLDGGAVL